MAGKFVKIGIPIIVVILIIVGLTTYFLLTRATTADVEATSSDGFATLSATFYDSNGNPIGTGIQQAIIEGTYQQAEYISFSLSASNTGSIDVENVRPDSPNANMDGAFDNDGSPPSVANLLVGQSNIVVGSTANSCTIPADCDTNEDCVGATQCLIILDLYASYPVVDTDFSISLIGDTRDALGNLQTGESASSPVTLTYRLLPDTCTDGTPINTCKIGSEPTYCEFNAGTAPALIPKATICGCPAGEQPSGDDCVPLNCPDGTDIDTFSVASGSYTVTLPAGSGTYSLTNGYEISTQTRVYCKSDQTLETQCNNAKTTLGGGIFTGDEACMEDYYSNDAIDCNPAVSEPSTCVYQTYAGGLSASIGQD